MNFGVSCLYLLSTETGVCPHVGYHTTLTMDLREWEFPQESHVGERKGQLLVPVRKRCHMGVTSCQQDSLELKQ